MNGEYISYVETKQYLEARFHATQDEIAQWVLIDGVLNGYIINEPEPPIIFVFYPFRFSDYNHYIKAKPIENIYFLADDINKFNPTIRYITRLKLIERWRDFFKEEILLEYPINIHGVIKFFNARMSETPLTKYHPIIKNNQATVGLFWHILFDINNVHDVEMKYKHQDKTSRNFSKNFIKYFKDSYTKELKKYNENADDEHNKDMRIFIEEYKFHKYIMSNKKQYSPISYDKFMGFCKQEPNNNKFTTKYGDQELLLNDAKSLTSALYLLDFKLEDCEEFALHIFYGTIRTFEKSNANPDEKLKQVVNIQDWLIQQGKCSSPDDKQYSIGVALQNFKYSKLELSQFKSSNQYISFKNAKEGLAKKINREINFAEKHLISALNREEIFAFYFNVGLVTPKLSMNGVLWQSSYFAKWQFDLLISQDFPEIATTETIVKVHENESIDQQAKTNGYDDDAQSKSSYSRIEISPRFAKFNGLRPNEVFLEATNIYTLDQTKKHTLTMVIKKNKLYKLYITPEELGLKHGSKGWSILKSAAGNNGDLAKALKTSSTSNDYENEKKKIKTTISRLNKILMKKMGLLSKPIIYENNTYKLIFNINYESADATYYSKGRDAMDHKGNVSYEENQNYMTHFSEYDDEFQDQDVDWNNKD